MLSLIDAEPTRSMSQPGFGFGLVSSYMTTSLGGYGVKPEILAAPVPYPIFEGEPPPPVIDFGLGQDGTLVGAWIGSMVLGLGAAALGAYVGSGRSRGWAAGGAIIGLLTLGILSAGLRALTATAEA